MIIIKSILFMFETYNFVDLLHDKTFSKIYQIDFDDLENIVLLIFHDTSGIYEIYKHKEYKQVKEYFE